MIDIQLEANALLASGIVVDSKTFISYYVMLPIDARALYPCNAPIPTCLTVALSFARAPLSRTLRGLVSKKKRRFIDAAAGLDLDLSYITNRVIATGYPARGLEALYRNPAPALRAFIAARHGPEAARVWNLCLERGYAPSLLGAATRVDHDLAWFDHCPPPFAFMRPLCEAIADWLEAAEKNVAFIRE